MTYTTLHHLVTPPHNTSDAWHLVEHVLVHAARRAVLARGNHLLDMMDVSGVTFDEVLFLRGEFYSKKALADYEQFWQQPQIELVDVEQALAGVACEERAAVSVDKQALLDLARWLAQDQGQSNQPGRLGTLSESGWPDQTNQTNQPDQPRPTVAVAITPDPHHTRDVRVEVRLLSDDVRDQQVFLRLRPPLLDATAAAVYEWGGYDRGATVVQRAEDDAALEFWQLVTTPRTVGLGQLERAIRHWYGQLARKITAS